MKDTGKLIAGLLVAAGTAIAVYYGFFFKLEDGLTAWQKLAGGGKKEEDPKDPGAPSNTGAVKPKDNKPGGKPKEPRPIDVIVPPKDAFAKGVFVYAGKDTALFSKPVAEAQYQKANAKRFDLIGSFDSENADYPGFSKVWVTTTFKNPKGTADVANKWTGFVKTDALTDKKV